MQSVGKKQKKTKWNEEKKNRPNKNILSRCVCVCLCAYLWVFCTTPRSTNCMVLKANSLEFSFNSIALTAKIVCCFGWNVLRWCAAFSDAVHCFFISLLKKKGFTSTYISFRVRCCGVGSRVVYASYVHDMRPRWPSLHRVPNRVYSIQLMRSNAAQTTSEECYTVFVVLHSNLAYSHQCSRARLLCTEFIFYICMYNCSLYALIGAAQNVLSVH